MWVKQEVFDPYFIIPGEIFDFWYVASNIGFLTRHFLMCRLRYVGLIVKNSSIILCNKLEILKIFTMSRKNI